VSGRTYRPAMDQEKREQLYNGWREAVRRTLSRR
jgi:glycerol kinase